MTALARLLVAALLLGGCSSYHFGSGTSSVRDIEVRAVRNASQLPGVHAPLHQALVSALAADKRLRVRDGGEPLETEVISVESTAATQSSRDTLVAGQIRVTMTARCTLRSADGRQVRFANRLFTASAILPVSGNLAGLERAAVPRLATELAAQVRDAAMGAW